MAHSERVSRRCFKTLGWLQPQQDLVVTEEVRTVESEVLVLIFNGEGKCYFAFEDHVEFGEVLAFLYDWLVCDEYTAVESGDEVADKLVAALETLATVVVREEVGEVDIDEIAEQFMD